MNQTQNKQEKRKYSKGRWAKSEKKRFILGYQKYGRVWVQVAKVVKTRKLAQVRSHAQKFFERIQKDGGEISSSFSNSDQIQYQEKSQSLKQQDKEPSLQAYSNSKIKQEVQFQQNQQQSIKKFQDKNLTNRKCIQATKQSIDVKQRTKFIFPNQQEIERYTNSIQQKSQFMRCLILFWSHFKNNGKFLQYPIIDLKNSKSDS